MGGAVSIVQMATAEYERPLDAADISSRTDALTEVSRLRMVLRDTTSPLDVGWQRVFDPSSNSIYYYNIATGAVQWDIPAVDRLTPEPPLDPPPMPTAQTFVDSQKLFRSRLSTASKCVVTQIRRQQVLWENDWHNSLCEYVAELRVEVDEIRKVDDKKYAKFTTSTEDRAKNAAKEAEQNAVATAQEMAKKKSDRHSKLMAKLAKKKKDHTAFLAEKKASHKDLLSKMKHSFKAASVFLGNGGADKTAGWVMLWDEDQKNCYYWHAEFGSCWKRPPEMNFNLKLENQTLQVGSMKEMKKHSDTNAALEKWIADNEMACEVFQDEKLEAEIAALEDELAKRRELRHGKEVCIHELMNVAA